MSEEIQCQYCGTFTDPDRGAFCPCGRAYPTLNSTNEEEHRDWLAAQKEELTQRLESVLRVWRRGVKDSDALEVELGAARKALTLYRSMALGGEAESETSRAAYEQGMGRG